MENDQQGPKVQIQSGANSPIGTIVMDTRVLKEPRGFIRVIQFFLGIITALIHTHFSTYYEYFVVCHSHDNFTVRHDINYPFRLDHDTPVNVSCDYSGYRETKVFSQYPPGDLKSSAVFFAFTGYSTAILAAAFLVVYVFFSQKYLDEQRMFPKIDCAVSFVFGVVFWLAASASWANGVITLKSICDPGQTSWLYTADYSICNKVRMRGHTSGTGAFDCIVTYAGRFGGANAAVILGFLNLFVWCAGLWFIYKETAWFEKSSSSRNRQQLPS